MFITFLTDCRDDNARARQESRVSSLTGLPTSFVGTASDLEASMNLIDVLDATEGRKGLVLVNVAPRGGHTRKWENGTPFGYFKHGETIVVATIDGLVLSAAKQLGLLEQINVFDIHEASEALHKAGLITEEQVDTIPKSQFRSFDFSPRVGCALLLGHEIPAKAEDLSFVPELPKAIWWIDNFGNCKTTITSDALEAETVTTRFGELPLIQQLKAVPDGESGFVRGSSGLGNTRFLELMTQRGSFAAAHNAQVGDDVFEERSHFAAATIS